MVHEVRKITLTAEEFSKALESYQRITPKFMPAGKIVGFKAAQNDGIIITLEMKVGSSVQATDVTLKAADILKPLIRFCPENNIILPRAGKKSASVVDDTVTLCIELEHAV